MDHNEPMSPALRARHQREVAAIERGLADVKAGRTISLGAVLAWLDKLDTDPNTPMPDPD